MKGTFFQRPLEFNLQIDGESWSQGDLIKGSLAVKSHNPDVPLPTDVKVHVAHGLLRKIRQKTPDAFKIISSQVVQPDGSWQFQTDTNFPITDHLNSAFIVYGQGAALEQLGQLQLNVVPHGLIQEFVKTLGIQFRFVLKGQKPSKGRVEVKFEPPSAQAFGMLEHILVYFSFKGEDLEVDYVFQVKKLESTPVNFDIKKLKREFSQTLSPKQYRSPSGRINHEWLEGAIKQALSQVESKVIF